MQPSVIIFGMIAVLFSMLFIVLVAGPLGAALKFIFRSAIGAGLIYILDIILSDTGIYIGINVFTAAVAGFLGLPGIISMAVISYIIP